MTLVNQELTTYEGFNSRDGAIDSPRGIVKTTAACFVSIPEMVRLIGTKLFPSVKLAQSFNSRDGAIDSKPLCS